MRKLALIVLMLLLPLQWSFAAVAEYCQHETEPSAQQHAGHHEHGHAEKSSDRSDGKQSVDADCAMCCAHGVYIHLSAHVSEPVEIRFGHGTAYSALLPDPLPGSLFRPPLAHHA